MIRVRIERPIGNRAFAFGLLLVAFVVTALLLASRPAHAATLTVNTTVDDSTANGNCTLREAIQAVNTSAAVDACAAGDPSAADTIEFGIPTTDTGCSSSTGVCTIPPSGSALPTITRAVTIDGYSQPGAQPDDPLTPDNDAKLLIELSGADAGSSSGLTIHSSNVVVKGLTINRFRGSGIVIDASPTGVVVEGSYIGTDASGTLDRGNLGRGVVFQSGTGNIIGGTTPEKRNLISGNNEGGILLNINADGNEIQGNYVGTKADGTTSLSNNGEGVLIIGGSGNTVGDEDPTDGDANAANTIAFNAGNGVRLITFGPVGDSPPDIPTGNRILSNSIFSNGSLGIDLGFDGVTQNDKKDPDTGPNNLQNFPVLSSATTSGGTTTIKGKLNSSPRKTFTIQFFSNPPPESPEGKKFIGQTTVKTSRRGNASFTFVATPVVNSGEAITATATNEATGDTSEFSAPVEAQ